MDYTSDPRLRVIQANWNQLQITQREAAEQFDISQSCFNQYLTGKIPLNTDTIIKFAILFDIPSFAIDLKLY